MINKYLIAVFSCCVAIFQSVAQISQEIKHPDIAGRLFQKALVNGVSRPEGSPYLDSKFQLVKVSNVEKKNSMRYNVFKDEFEFLTPANDTLIMDRIQDFGNLTFVNTNVNYRLCNYTNLNGGAQNGYLILIHEKTIFGLFKKENVMLTEEKIARTTLEQNMPPKYYKSGDVYFLKNKDKIIEFPSNKKKLIKIFPDKKDVIEKFVKENDIDFDKSIDKIKIIDFLETIIF